MVIRILQPTWRDDVRAEEMAAFWDRVAASPDYVVSVTVYDGQSWDLGGVFSTLDRALEWAALQGIPCVIRARCVDEPDWGTAIPN